MGGSGRAAYRIHQGLKARGAGSRMLVGSRSTGETDIAPIASHRLAVLDLLSTSVCDRLSLQYLFYPSSFALLRHPWFRESDVVQLYNTHGSYFSHTVLPRLSRAKPVFWRLSDMWPMTGHCVHAFDCTRWKTGCGSCPIPKEYPGLRHDTTALLWLIKRALYERSQIEVIAPSRWIARLAQESPLLGRFPVHVVPNGLDLSVFRPIPKTVAREVIRLPPERKVVLFAAASLSDPHKGLKPAMKALATWAQTLREPPLLLAVGGRQIEAAVPDGIEIRYLRHAESEDLMAILYSAADATVLPTAADTSPNVLLESLACGTPAVTFDVGGCGELVTHMVSGYVARPGDGEDLARGLGHVLGDDAVRERMAAAGIAAIAERHTVQRQVETLAGLYRAAIERRVETGGETEA
jgi:glycosyltransferase involved in cell wall biosynthesis